MGYKINNEGCFKKDEPTLRKKKNDKIAGYEEFNFKFHFRIMIRIVVGVFKFFSL